MSFEIYQRELIACLKSGRVNHVPRPDMEEKNLLGARVMKPEQVIALVEATTRTQYHSPPHDYLPRTNVHKFEPVDGDGLRWHIKLYFRKGVAWFHSVHPSQRQPAKGS